MKTTDKIIDRLRLYFEQKNVLEIACGDSDFSLSVSKYASKVLATDISLERFKRKETKTRPNNIEFMEMDAKNLVIEDSKFDITAFYNAIGHLEDILEDVLIEALRVTKVKGYLIIVATWKLDKRLMGDVKSIIDNYSELKIHEEIDESNYRIIIIQKL